MNAMFDHAREAWLQERRKGVGASDVAAIMGFSKWATPLEIFLEKQGRLPAQPETPQQKWGKILEPVILQQYAEATGRQMVAPANPYIHPDLPHMRVNLDGETACRRAVEAKTARFGENWGEEGTDEVPMEYLLQVQDQMFVRKFDIADIPALITGSDFRIYTVEADPEIQDKIVVACGEFWDRVQRDDPPPPIRPSDTHLLWGDSARRKSLTAPDDIEAAVKRLRRIRAQQIELDEAEGAEKTVIMNAMGRFDTLTDRAGMRLATWKMTNSRSGPYRRFMLR